MNPRSAERDGLKPRRTRGRDAGAERDGLKPRRCLALRGACLRRHGGGALSLLLIAACALPGRGGAGSSLSERFTEGYLSGLHAGAEKVRAAARPEARSGEWEDVRCVLHAHSGLSHDSRGTEAQIVAAAKRARVRAVFTTEHPTADRKWITAGLRGERDGVLFVPGAELSDGLLVWRGEKAEWTPGMTAGEVLGRLQGTDGVAFVAHPEKRKEDADWKLPPFAGMEIYNTHADAQDSDYEKSLSELTGGSLVRAFTLLGLLNRYPQEAFAAIFDEQTALLRRWDRLNEETLGARRHVVGIAGNDSHQNVGLTVAATEQGLRVTDALGEVVSEVPKEKLPAFLFGSVKPGTVVLTHTFDPYEVSMGYMNTHVLAREVTEASLFRALQAGRAYVSFDWMADPSGFSYTARAGKKRIEMGDETAAGKKPLLTARTNMPCDLRLLRNGETVRRVSGSEVSFRADTPGVYRVEAWVDLGSEERPWIYSNPIYVR
jgi:hypothetical protein